MDPVGPLNNMNRITGEQATLLTDPLHPTQWTLMREDATNSPNWKWFDEMQSTTIYFAAYQTHRAFGWED